MLYFAASTNGFYDSEIHSTMPDDAVQITREKYTELMTGQSEGNPVSSDSNSNPINVAPTPIVQTYIELRKKAYPPIEDYIDGVVKGDNTQIQQYITDCLAVKARYPKP
jgi:hypothetical protein